VQSARPALWTAARGDGQRRRSRGPSPASLPTPPARRRPQRLALAWGSLPEIFKTHQEQSPRAGEVPERDRSREDLQAEPGSERDPNPSLELSPRCVESSGPRPEARGPRLEARGPRPDARGPRPEVRGPRSSLAPAAARGYPARARSAERARRPLAPVWQHAGAGGKSELHRAGCWLTASRGDSQESATENKPPAARQVRVKWCGKSAPLRW
jgi:hypothetical protein